MSKAVRWQLLAKPQLRLWIIFSSGCVFDTVDLSLFLCLSVCLSLFLSLSVSLHLTAMKLIWTIYFHIICNIDLSTQLLVNNWTILVQVTRATYADSLHVHVPCPSYIIQTHRQNKHVAHCRISIHVRFDICHDRNIISWSQSFYTNRCVQFRAISDLILNKNCYTEKLGVVYWFKILMIVMFFNF